ncbi:MAG: AmmeMemoRadiSam system protein A [Gammaproteobacteria bacterium]|nr:AmmeMemoRadiSam system protein A [Gammaproteobacteria bacterium]
MPPSPYVNLSLAEQTQLLDLARQSIHAGLFSDSVPSLNLNQFGDNLRKPCAVFVTLTRNTELRGCIGSLQAVDALAQAVAKSAFNAAFRDRRFTRVKSVELEGLCIEISILSQMESLKALTRQDLLDKLQPGLDGLLLEDQGHRSTFLPKVWEKIPSANQFLEQLMIKAGLPAGHWSSTIRLQRYRSLSFSEN